MPSRDRKLAHLPSLPCPVGEAPNTPRTGDLPRLTVDIRHPPSRTLARPRRRLAAVDWQAFSHGCRFPLVHWWSSTSDPPDPTGPLNSIETPALGCLAKGCEAEVLVDQRGQRHRAQVPLSGSWQQLHRGALGRRGHFSIFKRTVLPVAITHPGPCSWVSVGRRMRCGPQRYGKCL